MMAYLRIMDGSQKDQKFDLKSGTTTIGRAKSNDIVFDDMAGISGNHCVITEAPAGFLVKDLDSTNGSRINGAPITEATIHRSDILTLGTTPMMLSGDDVPERPTTQIHAAEEAAGTSAHLDIRPRTTTSTAPVIRPKDFGKRQSSRPAWLAVFGILGLLLVVALVFAVISALK